MAAKVSLFLAALVVGFTITAATPFGEESERIIEETDLVVNGDLVHEQRETDGSCRQVKNTATLSDGSSSISYEDFEAGLELVTISNDTGTCFVKEISQDKKDEAETCKNGRVQRSEDQPDQEEEDLVEGPEVSAEDLSPRLRALCEGRKIVRMVPANTTQQSDDTGSDVDGGAGQSRQKRWIHWWFRCYRIYRPCYRICFFWTCRTYYCPYTVCYHNPWGFWYWK